MKATAQRKRSEEKTCLDEEMPHVVFNTTTRPPTVAIPPFPRYYPMTIAKNCVWPSEGVRRRSVIHVRNDGVVKKAAM